jgi:hypothetical protein
MKRRYAVSVDRLESRDTPSTAVFSAAVVASPNQSVPAVQHASVACPSDPSIGTGLKVQTVIQPCGIHWGNHNEALVRCR